MSTSTPSDSKVWFTEITLSEGSVSPVFDGSMYRGYLMVERSTRGSGWVFRACGPYGNLTHTGFRSPIDAAMWLAGHDDNGFPLVK